MKHHAVAIHDADDAHVVEGEDPPNGGRDTRKNFPQFDRFRDDLGDLGENRRYGLSVNGRGFGERKTHG